MNRIEPKYYIIKKCICCGKEYKSTQSSTYRQRCNECIIKDNEKYENLVQEMTKIKLQIMHENAIRKIETCSNVFQFCEIEESIKAIEKMEEISPDSFHSAAEIETTIGLYHTNFFFKINHKILNYSVDFYMPDEKICLEIDGGLHNIENVRFKDGRRDIDIRNELGNNWEIVRIPTSFAEKNPFLIGERAVDKAQTQRLLRLKNNGHLPRGYSESVDAYYQKVFD